MFVLRDIKIRYRQVQVGIAWCLLQPTLGMLIFLGIFWLVKARPTDESSRYASAASVVFLGLLVWQFVSVAVRDATGVLVNYRHIITKIAFPRFCLPAASVICAAFDACVASTIFPVLMLFTGDRVAWGTLPLTVIPLAALALFALGVVAWTSSLNAFYRDVGFALPFALQIGMFASPVIYDSSQVHTNASLPDWFKTLYAANPVANAIDWVRSLALGGPVPDPFSTAIAITIAALTFAGGMWWFRRSDRRLADRI